MVWTAIAFCIAVGNGWLALTYRADWLRVQAVLDERNADAVKLYSRAESEKLRAENAESRYDSLVEKIRIQAAKPDDGIIHAKNSGDVRRLFEREVSAEMVKREKDMEN
jgi:hypothetical protein